ncbi:MAG TPA: FkbM family methyltransferase [Hyphomicrobiaceae bacterium]
MDQGNAHRQQVAGDSKKYVWEEDGLLPNEGSITVEIGGLPIKLDLRFPHERRYALGFLHALRNPQADIDRLLFQRYVRPGDIVLDAGANIGVSAADALACGASHVVCGEPEQSLGVRLRSLEERSQGRLTVWECAFGTQEGRAELQLSRAHNQGHTISQKMISLFPSLFDGTRQDVKITTVDHVLKDGGADIWKLDVEGAEADVIKGAQSALERFPPRTIFAELYDPFVDEVIDLLPAFQISRAALSRDDYSLQLLGQIGGPLAEEFCPTSPTYVFIRRK